MVRSQRLGGGFGPPSTFRHTSGGGGQPPQPFPTPFRGGGPTPPALSDTLLGRGSGPPSTYKTLKFWSQRPSRSSWFSGEKLSVVVDVCHLWSRARVRVAALFVFCFKLKLYFLVLAGAVITNPTINLNPQRPNFETLLGGGFGPPSTFRHTSRGGVQTPQHFQTHF